MNKQQIQAIRKLGPVVRAMNKYPWHKAELVIDRAGGYRIEFNEEGGRYGRGWMFNNGGPSSDLRNLRDVRRWCGGVE